MRRHFLEIIAIVSLFTVTGAVHADLSEVDQRIWAELKEVHFGDRAINTGGGDVIGLQAPVRAEDAAIVPIIIEDLLPENDKRRISKIWLIIDRNPVPMSAEFVFSRLAGRADIATRVRVNAYTNMRAIAETDDGQLHMVTRYVKASGGCSAPASKDPAAALANLGEMKIKTYDQTLPLGETREAQLMLRHPNHTGLQMNQLTRLYTPAHFVKEISVDYAGHKVLRVKTTFSLSEDPSLRFSFRPRKPGSLTVKVLDTENESFTGSLQVDTVTAGK